MNMGVLFGIQNVIVMSITNILITEHNAIDRAPVTLMLILHCVLGHEGIHLWVKITLHLAILKSLKKRKSIYFLISLMDVALITKCDYRVLLAFFRECLSAIKPLLAQAALVHALDVNNVYQQNGVRPINGT